MIIDFTALMDRIEPWPKSNNFGHPTTVKKPPITPATPKSPKVGKSHFDVANSTRLFVPSVLYEVEPNTPPKPITPTSSETANAVGLSTNRFHSSIIGLHGRARHNCLTSPASWGPAYHARHHLADWRPAPSGKLPDQETRPATRGVCTCWRRLLLTCSPS
jgi:hypothetical protein